MRLESQVAEHKRLIEKAKQLIENEKRSMVRMHF